MKEIRYQCHQKIAVEAFKDLLQRSTLGERRPIDDNECLQSMLDHANLTVTAWDNKQLIGIARCVTDFHYCCYLSDLAVDQRYQKMGIGKALQNRVQNQLKRQCKLILIAAPAANNYYEQIGYTHNDRCWILDCDDGIKIE